MKGLRKIYYTTISLITLMGADASNAQKKEQREQPAQEAPKDISQSAINQAGELGEDLFDMAKEKKWEKAVETLATIQKAVDSLATQEKDIIKLKKAIKDLDKAIRAKNQQETMMKANLITLITLNLSDRTKIKIPADIVKLDYYGRELEIWVPAKNKSKVKKTVSGLVKTWDKIRPSVKDHGGEDVSLRFDELILKIKEAKSAKEYNDVTNAILDEVDNLEKVFEK
jgi:hypothetical protein